MFPSVYVPWQCCNLLSPTTNIFSSRTSSNLPVGRGLGAAEIVGMGVIVGAPLMVGVLLGRELMVGARVVGAALGWGLIVGGGVGSALTQ